MRFKRFIESASTVTINMTVYDQQQRAYVEKTKAFYDAEEQRLKFFQFDPNINVPSYPRMAQLKAAFNSPSFEDEINQYSKWSLDSKNYDMKDWEGYKNLRNVRSHLRDYQRSRNPDTEALKEYLDQKYQDNIQQTQIAMDQIKTYIEQLISHAQWNGSPVVIQPESGYSPYNSKEISFEPTSAASIYVGKASFGYWNDNGKVEIDDIIEGGEEDDFFTNPQNKADYYTLIKELKNPGSSSKGKVLTLYTARPSKDRDLYINATTLPINIFLTNSIDHAEGFSREYGGGRDIWKVRIDSKYLTQTLDGPIKYYMVSTENAPIVSISFLG